ncbi:hypothetical protein [Bradyrhizobium embrapense]
MQLVGEGGPEAVRVREAARRAAVSPGAPFRHFPPGCPDECGGRGGTTPLPGRDRGGAGRCTAWRSAGPLPLPWDLLSALGDEEPDPFRDHLQPPLLRPRPLGRGLQRQCGS